MGSDSQPFLYDGPSAYSFAAPSQKGFNPRAASEATWRAPLPKPKSEGPLIQSKEFNRHPDSYFVVPYGNLNWTSMSPRTKDKVKWARITLLLLRALSLCGAIGMLFCVICIRNTDAMTGWIIRIPAGIAILHAVYAIYHLARSSRGRTPASSASYMLFAATVDVSLIPFYVYAALMARVELAEPVGASDRWITLFNDNNATYKIIYSTYLISVVSGSLHLISFILSLYLGVLYRKISRLPPDMNPLEENLTSRHKRNKSSLVDIRNSQASTVASKGGTEGEVSDTLISPVRMIPFQHTRNSSHLGVSDQPQSNFTPLVRNSNTPITLHPNTSKNYSNLTLVSSHSALPSRKSPDSKSGLNETFSTNENKEGSTIGFIPQTQSLNESPPRQGRPQEYEKAIGRSLTKSSSIYSTDTHSTVTTTPGNHSISNAIPLADHNWVTHPSSLSSHSPSTPRELKKAAYQPLSQVSNYEYNTNDENRFHHLPGNPLEMNPPAPKVKQWKQRMGGRSGQGKLAPGDNNVRRLGSWSQGPGTLGIGKVRTWGGVNGLVGHSKESARVVSRSGIQIDGEAILPIGGVRAREVSGKVMEEGRGKSDWHVISD